MKTYRVAILGCRARGTAAARAYHAHPRTEIVGLCDLVQERLDALGDELGVAARYTDMTSQISYHAWGSDHMPFLNKKIPTVLNIESEFDDNPNYHKTSDLPGAINFDLCHQILRLNAALLAEYAGVQAAPAEPAN